MATYTLADGTRKTQLTISGDTTVVFPTKLDYFGVRSLDGASILVSKIKAPTVLEDGVYSTDEGDGDVVVDDGVFTDTLYLKGTGTVVVYGGAKSNHLPFKVGGKGGGGSGSITIYYTTTALTDNATTNPITVNGESVTVNANEFAIYGKKEFVFDGVHWHEFGDLTDTVGMVDYVDTDTESVGYPANGEVFNSESSNSATARGAHAEGIAARAFGEGSHAESYSMAQAQGSHAHGAAIVTSTAAFATAMGDHAIAQAFSSTVVGTYNKIYNTSQGETIPDLLFVVGNGKGMVFQPQAHLDQSNILEVDYTSMNVNGDIQRNGVGIDDYTTAERKIGKWIDGSDLYQRTFEVTTLANDNQWHVDALGTSGIDIVDFGGYVDFNSDGSFADRQPLNMWISSTNYMSMDSIKSDLEYRINRPGVTIDKAIITIKYTKPSVQANTLNANIQQTEEPTDEMR